MKKNKVDYILIIAWNYSRSVIKKVKINDKIKFIIPFLFQNCKMKLDNKKILIISHPDKIIGCGGLIAKCKLLKSTVSVLYVTVGLADSYYRKTDFETRKSEIQDVSKYGNFDYKILFEDKYFVELDTLPQKTY